MLLLACLVGFAAAMPSGDQSYDEMRALWFSKSADIQRILSFKLEPNARTFHTLGTDPNAACLAAEQKFFTLAQTCLTVGYIFNGSHTASDAQVESDITNYCAAGGCNDQMQAAVDGLDQNCRQNHVWQTQCPAATNCSAAPYPCAISPVDGTCEPDPKFLTTIRFILSLFCLQGPDGHGGEKYCVPSFYAFVNPTQSCDLATRLANGCDNCTVQIFSKWSQVEPLEAAIHFMQLALECLNLNGTWCIIQQAQFQNYSNQLAMDPKGGECNTFSDAASCTNATRGCVWKTNCQDDWTGPKGDLKLGYFCHPCVGAFLWRTVKLIALADILHLPDNGTVPRDLTAAGALVTLFVRSGVCATDLKDHFCLPELQQATPDFNPPCNGIAQLVNQTGCCAASFVSFEEAVCKIEVMAGSNTTCIADIAAFKTVVNSCPTGLGETCAVQKFKAFVKFTVTNLNDTWWADPRNQDILVKCIVALAAYNGGVNESSVNAQVAPGRRLVAGGTAVVTANVAVGSNSEFFSVNQGLSPLAPLETLDLNQNVPSGGLAPVQVTSSGLNPATSSATKAMGGFVAALVIAISAALA